MASIDTRVVEAQFKNDQFNKGTADTLSALDKLKAGLRLEGATEGSTNAARGLQDLGSQTDGIGGRFSAMSAIAFGALASIGAKAVAVGSQMAQAFTTGPIIAGFQEYETNMNSIQTILANTSVSGAGLPEVNAALDELNHYSDQTIYNFSEMARNIGTFTAAGVDLDTATGSIKGIANLAALSGSNSQQASGAMYQLSQAISSGRVSLQDWNSVVNAGMGGTVFQRALAQTAEAMGTLSEGSVQLSGDMQNVTIAGQSFRESIDASGDGPKWLTSDVLTTTLQQFTGDMTDAELAAQGFSAEMIASIQAQASTAVNAATEVKTFSGLMDTLKEGVTSGWSQSFRIIIGDFEEAKQLFTGLSNAIGGFFGRIAENRNTKLEVWKDLGGRQMLIDGLTDAFWALGTPLAKIGQAFREVFPASTGADLMHMTTVFRTFMLAIQPSPETLDRIQRTARGVFAVFGILWEVVKGLAGVFGDLINRFSQGDGGILKFTASIGDFLFGLYESIKAGEGLGKFFDGLSDRLGKVVDVFQSITNFFGELVNGLDLGPFGEQLGELVSKILAFGSASDESTSLVDKITGALGRLVDMARNVGEWAGNMGETLATAFSDLDYEKVMAGLQTGMIAGVGGVLASLASSLRNFSIFGNSGNGIFKELSDGLHQVSGTLQSMQNENNAGALLKLAGAIGILALSVMLLASLSPQQLIQASIALGVLFVELTKGMASFNAAVGIMGAAKLNLIGPALIGIAVAVLIFVAAIALLAQMSWADLAKGMTALGILLGMLVGAVTVMSGKTSGMVGAAVALTLMAVAINLLVLAVKQLSDMNWEEMAQGFVGVAALLTGLALFTKFSGMGAQGAAAGVGLAFLAGGILMLSIAVKNLADLSWPDMIRGLAGMTIALAVITATMKIIGNDPKVIFAAIAIGHIANSLDLVADVFIRLANLSWSEVIRGMMAFAVSFGMMILAIKAIERVNFGQLAGLGIVTAAIKELAEAMEIMGKLSWEEITHGVVAMIGTIGVLVIALKALEKVPANAGLALGLVAASISLLAPALATMGAIPIVGIVGALVLLAGVFGIIGLAAKLLASSVPVLLGLGIAIGLLGLSVALAGAGVLAFSIGLTTLGAAGAAATAGIVAIVSGLIGLIPLVIEQIGLGIVAFAEVIANSGDAILAAIGTVLNALLQAFIDVLPKVGEAILELLATVLRVLVEGTPQIVAAGFSMLIALLQGIRDNIGQVVTTALDIMINFLQAVASRMGGVVTAGVDVIVAFINGIANNIGRIIDAGFNLIVEFLNGIANAIREHSGEITDAALDIVDALIDGIVDGIGEAASRALDAVQDLVSDLWDSAMDFLGIGGPSKLFRDTVGHGIALGTAEGITENSGLATDAVTGMGNNLLNTMGKTITGLGDMVGNTDDFTPVITPVLDLSNVQRDSSLIGDMLGAAPIDLTDTLSKAGDASAGYNANQDAVADLVAANAGTNVSLTQINNSPKALSPAEIYRNTNNQLSQARSTLKNAN